MLFQYIGLGCEDDPKKTKFMGKHDFTLNGTPVEVTDASTVKKLLGNKTFRSVLEGEVLNEIKEPEFIEVVETKEEAEDETDLAPAIDEALSGAEALDEQLGEQKDGTLVAEKKKGWFGK